MSTVRSDYTYFPESLQIPGPIQYLPNFPISCTGRSVCLSNETGKPSHRPTLICKTRLTTPEKVVPTILFHEKFKHPFALQNWDLPKSIAIDILPSSSAREDFGRGGSTRIGNGGVSGIISLLWRLNPDKRFWV